MKENNKGDTPERRSRVRGEENRARFRERILAEAKSIYAQEGYDAVSVRAVTKAVGISPMAFYGYFVSKQDLVKYIWLDFFEELHDTLVSAIERKRSPVSRLTAHVEAYLGYWERYPDRYRMVYQTTGATDERENIRFEDEDTVIHHLLDLGRQRVVDCADGRPLADVDARLHADLMFVKALGYLHGSLTVKRYSFADQKRLRACVIADIVRGVTEFVASAPSVQSA